MIRDIKSKKYSIVVLFLFIIILSLWLIPANSTAEPGIDVTDETETALDGLGVDIEPIEDDVGDRGDGQVRYNITVRGEIRESGLPLQYPVRVTIYDLTSYSGPNNLNDIEDSSDAVELESYNTILNPTQPDTFVPSINRSDDRERVMSRKTEVNLAFRDLLNEDGEVTKDVGVFAESLRSTNDGKAVDNVEVKGPLPAGVTSSNIQRNEDENILTEVSFVDEYRITSQGNPQFGENMDIPGPTDSKLRGDMTRFGSMKSPFGEAAVVSGQTGVSFVTRTIGLPSGRPYTATISYTIPEGEEVYVNPLNPVGENILEETEYRLPSDADEEEYCREVETGNGTVNLCTLYLNEGEVDSISGVAEAILHYESEKSTTISINCQSIISGYLPRNTPSCGVNPSDSGITEPIASSVLEAQGQSNNTNSGGWKSNRVNVLEDPNGETDHYIRYNVSSTINGTLTSGDYEIRIYNESQHISEEGEIISGSTPIYRSEISDYNETWNDQIVIENQSVKELPSEYHLLLCQTGLDVPSECGIEFNTDYENIIFTQPPSPRVDLEITSPVIVKPLLIDRIEEDAINVRTKTIETPDENYQDGTPWEETNGGDPVVENFSGTVKQEVTIEDVYEDEIDNLRGSSSEIFQEAVERRSDGIPEGLWDYDVSVSRVETKEIFIPQSEDISDYVSTDTDEWTIADQPVERTIQTGFERESFPIVTGDSFAAKVEGQERWYPLRDTSTSDSTTEFIFDTRLQMEDPDNCLNCLPTETYGQAFDRLAGSQGGITTPIGTSGFDAWQKVNKEDVIVNGREIASSFFRRAEVSGATIVYRNINPLRDDYKYRHRQSQKNNKRLSLWEYSNEIIEPTFERPLTEPVERYTRNKYEVTYNFRADLQEERDIYRYEKTVLQNLTYYEDGHIAWVDLSDSKPSDKIEEFEVKFEDAEESIRVDWIEGIHSVPPQNRDSAIVSACKKDDISEIGEFDNTGNYPVSLNATDSNINKLQYLSGLKKGVGGTPVVQKCIIDGEEKIVRVGQQYEEPGTFNYDVELVRADESEKGIVEVIPERQGEPPKDPTTGSEPVITEFEAINDRVDYRVGTVALRGEIASQSHNLNSPYEITVTPADNIDASSVSCGELGGNYKSVDNRTLTQTYQSGDTFREVEKCIIAGFNNPNIVKEEFEIQRVTFQYVDIPLVGEVPRVINTQASDIPSGAIQECRQPLVQKDSGQCIAPEELEGLSQDNPVEFGSPGSYQPVSKVDSTTPALGQSCPYMYESNVEIDESGTDQFTVITNCELQNSEALSIDLRSRTVSYQYQSVESGVVEQCTDIPTAGQERDHSGYEDNYDRSDSRAECSLVDNDDAGPTPFGLYETEYDPNTGQSEREYEDIPAGAFRAKSFITGEKSDKCAEVRVESDGSMICDYKKGGGETVSVRFATRERGVWTSTSDTVSNVLDQTNARKSIWKAENMVPTVDRETYKENFTTTINPRNIGAPISQEEVDFTIELRNKSSGEVIQEESVTVGLCAAGQISDRDDLPREYMGPYECEDFDTMMTGENDFQGGMTVEDALSEYTQTDMDSPVSYTISSVTNDACPYTHEFPRDQESLLNNPSEYTFTIDADNTTELKQEEQRIRNELQEILGSQYSPLGNNPCERFDQPIEENIPTLVKGEGDFTIEFNKNSFSDNSNQNFTRVAALEDLHMITENPVQSRWEKGDLGGGVRLGTPILLKYSPTLDQYAAGIDPVVHPENKGLTTHYTFDHDPSKQLQFTRHTGERANTGSASTTAVTVPNHFVVQDVGMPKSPVAPDGTERDFEKERFLTSESPTRLSRGIHNARIWHSSPCHAQSRYEDGRIFNPSSIQPVRDNIGPTVNSQAFTEEPCEGLLTSKEATEIAEYEFVGNYHYNELLSPYPMIEGRLNNSVPTNQSAYLPIKPTKDWKDQYTVDESNKIITDAYKSVEDNYAEGQGIFGGNALRLEDTSWLMITPPCHDRDSIGDQIQAVSGPILGGDQGSCDPYNDVVGPDDSNWRGGWKNAYTDDERQLEGSNMHKKIDKSYTVSFWVNTEAERSSMDSVSATSGDSVSPVRTLFSTSSTVENPSLVSNPNPDIIPSTAELGLVKAPKRISLENIPDSEIDSSDVLSGSFATPKSWDYPSHFNLRDTARSCITYNSNPEDIIPDYDGSSTLQLTGNQRPVMCEIFELSESEYAEDYDDLTEYTEQDLSSELYEPPFMEEFRKEMVDRIVWEDKIDWPVGPAVKRGTQRFPAYDKSQRFAGASRSPSGCYFATQRNQTATGDRSCYENGRYVFSDGPPGYGGIKADQTFKSSDWQHISISYDNTSENEFSVYINGREEVNVSENELHSNSDLGKESVRIGKLYDNSVMSLGAVYQDPGYNFDPNNLSEEFAADFVPYVHSTKGEVLVDELRIYNQSLEMSDVRDREIPDADLPGEHNIPVDQPMYTGELTTEQISSDANSKFIGDLFNETNTYRTFEVDVDAFSKGPGGYRVNVVPCTYNGCVDEATVSVSEVAMPEDMGGYSSSSSVGDTSGGSNKQFNTSGTQGSVSSESYDISLSGTKEVIRFSPQNLTDDQIENITGFRLEMEIGSPYLDSTPVIQNIQIQPAGDPYSSCQEIARNNPGSIGLYGSEFEMTIVDSTGSLARTECDMRRAGGEWTQFAWVDTSDGNSFSKDTETQDRFFIDDMNMSDCSLDDSACFATAEWRDNVVSNVGSDSGLYPQIMVKAVKDGDVVNWATFELNEQAHDVIESGYGVDRIPVTENITRIFTGEAGRVTGDGPDNYAGQNESAFTLTSSEAQSAGLYSKCLYPFDNGAQFDRRCISHIQSVTPQDSGFDTTRLSMLRMHIDSINIGTTGSTYVDDKKNPGSAILEIERDDSSNTITNIECLGESGNSVDRCEFYYRAGDDFTSITQDKGVSKTQDVFDLDDYALDRDTREVSGTTAARGYIFEPKAETEIKSLFSSYSKNSSGTGSWWIALFEMSGNTVQEIIASKGDVPNGEFLENSLDGTNAIIEPGTEYAIVQGSTDRTAGNLIGYSPETLVGVSQATSDHPIKNFKPTQEGYAFVFPGGATGPGSMVGETVDTSLSPLAGEQDLPRLGFRYEVIDGDVPDISRDPAVGYIADVTGSRDANVMDISTKTLYHHTTGGDHSITTDIQPDRTGNGVYFGNSDGWIINVKYDDYTVTPIDTFDLDEDRSDVVARTGLSSIEELKIDQNGRVGYAIATNVIAAFDLSTGAKIWEFGFSSADYTDPVEMSLGDDHVYAANAAGNITQINKTNGELNESLEVEIEGRTLGTDDQRINAFDANEDSNKMVFVDGSGAPKLLTMSEFRSESDGYVPTKLEEIEGLTDIIYADDGEVEIADDGRFAVWMMDNKSIDNNDVTHGIATYDENNSQIGDPLSRYYIPGDRSAEDQLINELSISPGGRTFLVGTEGDVKSAEVRVYHTNTLDRTFRTSAGNSVRSLNVFGKIR
jgi:hypothetical protein